MAVCLPILAHAMDKVLFSVRPTVSILYLFFRRGLNGGRNRFYKDERKCVGAQWQPGVVWGKNASSSKAHICFQSISNKKVMFPHVRVAKLSFRF